MSQYKYRNHPTTIDGQRFASQLEGRRYNELKLLQWAGQISDLKTQVSYDLAVNGQHIARYVADFTYTDREGKMHVEDAKGVATSVYKLKKKLMKACHGVAIEEV